MFDARKYQPATNHNPPTRTWPSRTLDHPPIWCSVDLRDGNQALAEPMGHERKLRLFKKLLAVGFKEIEVGFPAASQTDFDFVRFLIKEKQIPNDVTIQVLTQAREPLIKRTIESLQGARRAIVHLYNSTNPLQRRVVFRMSKADVLTLAVQGTRYLREHVKDIQDTEVVLQYSPESFSATELDFAADVVDAVVATWDPSASQKMIINLPATVESSTPNIYADQIEWMHTHIKRRDQIILSVHTHNDRGCAVAAAEMAMLAGADRVEGTLFGNGERTGNADIVTLALNLYSQGISPGLDFSDLPSLVETYEACNQMLVPPRQPYAGELVFTAFSGSHQDAIAKGLSARAGDTNPLWEVPYLPIDPADVGRTYDALIRINSQSGKSGVRYILEHAFGYRLPKELAIELSQLVQAATDRTGKELTADQILQIFEQRYLANTGRFTLVDYEVKHADSHRCQVNTRVREGENAIEMKGEGEGTLAAFVHALSLHTKMPLTVVDYSEHAMGRGTDVEAAAYVKLTNSKAEFAFGVGRHNDIIEASFIAVVSALNRLAHEVVPS